MLAKTTARLAQQVSVPTSRFKLQGAACFARCASSAAIGSPRLWTPGPLTTSATVKNAMSVDMGSRDPAFLRVVSEVRSQLVELGGAKEDTHSTIIVQGSGTFAVEATVASVVPRQDPLLVVSNGAYGERIATIAKTHDIPTIVLRFGERDAAMPQRVSQCLQEHPDVKHVALVHHETTAGVLNPVREIAAAVARTRPGASIILDSMSAFGAYPVDMPRWGIDYVVSSANKCIEGVPGFAFTIANRERLAAAAASGLAAQPRSVSLDLHAQAKGLDASGQFRFTPPTHALLAFHTALKEHTREGGSAGRLKRCVHCSHGQRRLGVQPPDAMRSLPAPCCARHIS